LFLMRGIPAHAQERLCDNSYEDCRAPLIQLIRNEKVGIDVSYWFMTDWYYSSTLIAKWRDERVPIRVILDTQADVNYPASKTIRTNLANAGIPIRDCISSSGINHWKAMIFAGQGKVQFSAANYSEGSFSPTTPYLGYVDEAIYFTDDAPIVQSFMRKFDDHWTDTTAFANLANISGPLVRNYPTYPVHPDMNFVPGQNFEERLRSQVMLENEGIDAVIFRITSGMIPDALIARRSAGVPVRLITEERQYRNTSYFWDSYNIDRMYMAGIQIKIKDNVTEQDMHQKSMILHSRGLATSGAGPMAVFGSSNWTSSSAARQREHNYFTRKPWMVDWFIDQFERKWNNRRADGTPIGSNVYIPFTPLLPETAVYLAPANDALGQTATVTLRWEGGWWAHKYDIYVATTPTFGAPIVVDYRPGAATAGTVSAKESYTISDLQPATTYYWRIVSKTMADRTKVGPTWRFTTAGGVPPPPTPSGLTATAISTSRIDLAWTDVAGEEGYKIERRPDSSTTWAQIGTTGVDVARYEDSNSGLSPGATYYYRVRAFTTGGNSGYSNVASASSPSPSVNSADVVLYAARASVKVGSWSVVADSTAAGGQRLSNPNAGAATVTTPLVNPAHYFEIQFTASANRPYRLWMRGKATNNNGYNDSVHVQFSSSVTAGGAPVYRIGTTSAAWVNLQDCAGCTLNGWGWQDNAYGGFGPEIFFGTSGVQTIRVQVREDGPSFDQIVLSPETYLYASPGATKMDNVILPENGRVTQVSLTGPAVGATLWGTIAGNTTGMDDAAVSRVEPWVDGTRALTDASGLWGRFLEVGTGPAQRKIRLAPSG